jgi:hypothetical protein
MIDPAQIPAAALEAGFNALAEGEENAYTTRDEDLAAAFLAMLEAWPVSFTLVAMTSSSQPMSR